GDRVDRQQPNARQLVTALVAIEVTEELIAAAHRQRRGSALDRLVQGGAQRCQSRRDQLLLAVLAAAHVEEVVLAGAHAVVRAERPHLELVPPPGGPLRQNGDVAAVGVDVQVVREEVADDEPHAASSQYGLTKPRRAMSSRSASIAV